MLQELVMGVSAGAVALSLFGWSHGKLSTQIETLAAQLSTYLTAGEVRTLISDKLEPLRVEVRMLQHELTDAQKETQKHTEKLDQVLHLITTKLIRHE